MGAELDAEDVKTEQNMLKLGFSKEEIARLRGRPAEQVGKPALPVVTLANVERDLAEIAALRKSGDKAYWAKEVQAKELALIEQREALRAGKAAAPAPAAPRSELEAEADKADKPEDDAIDAELAAIRKARRENPKSYTDEVQARELELIAAKQAAETAGLDPGLVEEWSNSGGVEHNLGVARATAQAVIDELEPDDAAVFQQSFDALPEAVRTEAFRHMALDGGGTTRPATDASVAAFAGIGEEAASLVKGWGAKAGQRLGAAYATLNDMMGSLSEADEAAAHAWLGGLSPAQKAAMFRALGGR